MFNRNVFFWKIGFLGMILSGLDWCFYRRGLTELQGWPSLLLFLILPFFFSLAYNAIHLVPVRAAKCFSWIGGFWFIFTLYSTFAVLLYALIFLFVRIVSPASWAGLDILLIRSLSALVLLLIACGTLHACRPAVRHITLGTEKFTGDLTIAFLTDLHLSPIQSHAFARRLARKVNALAPDLVIFGGDLIDAHLDFVLRDGSYRHLGEIQAPLGVWAVFGNHDFFDGSIRKEAHAMKNIHFLCHAQAALKEHLVLTGLNDYLHYPLDPVPGCDPKDFNILIDHEPMHISEAEEKGYDLYLGGHTHAGQFFPVTAVTSRLFLLNYGLRRFGRLTAYVSSGYGAWGFPFRTGPSPEIVCFHLQGRESGKETAPSGKEI